MKRFFPPLLAASILCAFQIHCSAQNSAYGAPASNTDSTFIRVNNALYALGTEINDNNLRQTALANLLSYDADDTFTLFRLVDVYFNNKAYLQAFLLTKKYLNSYRDNLTLLEYYSKSAEVLGKFGDAVTGYKKLYILTEDVYYGYLNASAQSALGKYALSNIAAQEVIARFSGLNNNYISITFGGGEDKAQKVPIKAALWELMGVNFLYIKDKTKAREALLSALREFPDFEEAKENLQLINR
jgi:tetratricopeptide (TPR) repeat protein